MNFYNFIHEFVKYNNNFLQWFPRKTWDGDSAPTEFDLPTIAKLCQFQFHNLSPYGQGLLYYPFIFFVTFILWIFIKYICICCCCKKKNKNNCGRTSFGIGSCIINILATLALFYFLALSHFCVREMFARNEQLQSTLDGTINDFDEIIQVLQDTTLESDIIKFHALLNQTIVWLDPIWEQAQQNAPAPVADNNAVGRAFKQLKNAANHLDKVEETLASIREAHLADVRAHVEKLYQFNTLVCCYIWAVFFLFGKTCLFKIWCPNCHVILCIFDFLSIICTLFVPLFIVYCFVIHDIHEINDLHQLTETMKFQLKSYHDLLEADYMPIVAKIISYYTSKDFVHFEVFIEGLIPENVYRPDFIQQLKQNSMISDTFTFISKLEQLTLEIIGDIKSIIQSAGKLECTNCFYFSNQLSTIQKITNPELYIETLIRLLIVIGILGCDFRLLFGCCCTNDEDEENLESVSEALESVSEAFVL